MRLIDADALLFIFASKIKKITPIGYSRDAFHHDSGRNGAWVSARSEVNKAPTIDAVPVIRCKNCKHWSIREGNDPTLNYFCNRDGMWCKPIRKPNDFCSYGEPRGERKE